MSDGETRAIVRALLESHSTITLATVGKDGDPWTAAVFYASDADLNLCFVSDQRTRHGRDLAADPRVTGAINRDVATWDEVLGLQIAGRAAVLDGSERDAALAVYLRKFADVGRLFASPRDDSERVIAERLRATAFWRLRPAWIRVIDNSRGFGWKREISLPG